MRRAAGDSLPASSSGSCIYAEVQRGLKQLNKPPVPAHTRERTLRRRVGVALTLLAGLILGDTRVCPAYSVITHQAIIDLAWEGSIRPLLLSRFPHTTNDQLTIAHAHAYGGCAIQDAGYYPFGSQFFSNLTHYVRSGDFVSSLFRNARNVNEYAFAIGALSHYVGDSIGHADAINPATALAFPKLRAKYGPIVTYEQAPRPYVATEFSFDVNQISKDRFAPDAYLRSVGLRVSRDLLERAFYETYGLRLTAVLGKATRPAIRSYRGSIRSFIPVFAKAEVVIHGDSLPEDAPGPQFERFSQRLQRVPYRPAWADAYRKPGFGEHVLAAVIRILPPTGAVRFLKFHGPNSQAEGLYIESVNRTLDVYGRRLAQVRLLPELPIELPNRDLDTGDWTRPGAYVLTDETYAQLLAVLTADRNRAVPAALKQDIASYYADPNAPITTKQHARQWKRVQDNLLLLKQMKTTTTVDSAVFQ